MNLCENGPIMVIYPQGWWYYEVTEEKLDEIPRLVEAGVPAEEYLMA